ncbi:MAG: anti-sigma-I factor RsgI family protein [Desulfosporosinus sp.]|jgi:hypothetical protein
MNKVKAVVLEKSGSRYTVLGRDGSFRQVRRRINAEIGEEFEIRTGLDIFGGIRVWAGAAALFLLVLTALLWGNLYHAPTAVALFSVDINPSLEFVLDAQGDVLELKTQNEDAKRMLSQIDLQGKPLEEVLEQIVTQAYDQQFLRPDHQWVVVGYSPMPNKTLEEMPEKLNENQINTWITEIGEKKGLIPQVAVFSLTSQERELAQKENLTLGEYALWQTADKAGVVIQPEKLKETTERVRLLENPKVQVQIKAKKNGRQAMSASKNGNKHQQINQDIVNTRDKARVKALDNAWDKIRSKALEKTRGKSSDNVRDKTRDNTSDKNKTKDKTKDNAKDNIKNDAKDNARDKTQNNVGTSDNNENKQKAKDQKNKEKNSKNKWLQQTKYYIFTYH